MPHISNDNYAKLMYNPVDKDGTTFKTIMTVTKILNIDDKYANILLNAIFFYYSILSTILLILKILFIVFVMIKLIFIDMYIMKNFKSLPQIIAILILLGVERSYKSNLQIF
jgi:hypothetical protein